jgi:hypothetical protein
MLDMLRFPLRPQLQRAAACSKCFNPGSPMLVLRWNTRVVPTIGVRAACARRIFFANQDVRVIRLTCCYRVLSKCCLKLGELVDLRRIASERIKETPAVLEARTQSEGGNRTGPRD